MILLNPLYLNQLFSLFLKKIIIPDTFKEQAEAVEIMQRDDVTGLVDSLTDFAVDSAVVEYGIETENENLNKILKKWIKQINKDYRGKIPPGIKALSKEYFKERWKGASFPVLKITKWDNFGGFQLPARMFFVDGKEIHAIEKDKESSLTLNSYDYYLGTTEDKSAKLDAGVIFSRPYGRWFDKYPVPFLIKRGIYHNFKIIESLKTFGNKIIEEVIPYMMLVKKGNDALTNAGKTYTDAEFKDIYKDLQELLRDYRDHRGTRDSQTKLRVTDYAEDIKHLIPDLATAFTPKLFEQAEKNILGGLGFIDIVQSVSESRRESVINPKAFIEEIRAGVEDFKLLLYQIVLLAIEKNSTSSKYKNADFVITASPVRGFMSDKFKQALRLLWKHGQLSNQTYCELVGEVEFSTELSRREKEAKNGTEITMYPHITDNRESDVSPEEQKRLKDKNIDVNGKPIPRDKLDDRDRFDMSSNPNLEISPYNKTSDLPSRVRKNMSPDLQRTFISVFNNSVKTYNSETRAFRVAWSIIKRIGRQNKKGIWVRKSRRIKGKLEPIKLERAMLEKVINEEEKKIIDEVMQTKKVEIQEKQSKLLDKLLKNENK